MIELVMQYVAVIAGPIAAVWALLQWGDSIRQRKREFRWRQVDAGRQLTDELFDDPIAGDGLEIIDEELDRITLKDGTSAAISPHDIKAAMAFDTSSSKSEVHIAIRRRFDAVFYRLERIQRCVELNLVKLDDVSIPTAYYCKAMGRQMDIFDPYLAKTGYLKAKALIIALQTTKGA